MSQTSFIQFPMVLKGYAIFNPNTGLWSKGGNGPEWRKAPKVWSNMGPLKNHLLGRLLYTDYYNKEFRIYNKYKFCKVIDVSTGKEVEDFNPYDYVLDHIKKQSTYYTDYKIKYVD